MSEFQGIETHSGLTDFGQRIEHWAEEIVHPHETELKDEIKKGLPWSAPAVPTHEVTPDGCHYRTFILAANQVQELTVSNVRRSSITITTQSGGTVTIGGSVGITAGGATGVAIPVGAFRTLTHQARLFAVSAVAGTVLDIVEEYFRD